MFIELEKSTLTLNNKNCVHLECLDPDKRLLIVKCNSSTFIAYNLNKPALKFRRSTVTPTLSYSKLSRLTVIVRIVIIAIILVTISRRFCFSRENLLLSFVFDVIDVTDLFTSLRLYNRTLSGIFKKGVSYLTLMMIDCTETLMKTPPVLTKV